MHSFSSKTRGRSINTKTMGKRKVSGNDKNPTSPWVSYICAISHDLRRLSGRPQKKRKRLEKRKSTSIIRSPTPFQGFSSNTISHYLRPDPTTTSPCLGLAVYGGGNSASSSSLPCLSVSPPLLPSRSSSSIPVSTSCSSPGR